mgnify:CR=1 FL=1
MLVCLCTTVCGTCPVRRAAAVARPPPRRQPRRPSSFAVAVGDGLAGCRRRELIGRAGVSRRADRFREQGAMRRSGDGDPTAAAVSPGNPPPA